MKEVLSRLLIISVMVLTISSTIQAGDKPNLDERAFDHLTQMGNYLAAAEEFSFKAEVTTDEVNIGIHKIHTTEQIEAVVHRPNKLWLDERGDLYEKSFWYDGKNASLLSYAEDMYATVEAASTTEKMLDEMMAKYGVTSPVVDFLVDKPHLDLLSAVTSGVYVGLHKVDGVSCHHLAFTQDNVDWQIWIDTGKKTVPLKFIVTYKMEPGSPEVITVFKDWEFSSKYPDKQFEFKAPKSARKIDFLPLAKM
jgi:hypothetical protein